MDLKMINSKLVTVEDLENIQYLSEFKLTEKAYMDYIGTIRWNYDVDYDCAKKKIIRNLILSNEAHENKYEKEKKLYYYGNLQIMINTITKEIFFIKNTLGVEYEFKLDREKRRVLNYIMNIEEGK